MEISTWMSHGFLHIKRGKRKLFPIAQASDFSHTTLMWLHLQGTKRGTVQSDTAQPRSKLITSSDRVTEEQCCHRCLHQRDNQRELHEDRETLIMADNRVRASTTAPTLLASQQHSLSSPGNEYVLLGEALVLVCIWTSAGTITV